MEILNNLKNEILTRISKKEDIDNVEIIKSQKRCFVIISEDLFVIETFINEIVRKVKETNTNPDDITVIITNTRMIKKMDKESNNEFSKALFGKR